MKIKQINFLIRKGPFGESVEFKTILEEIEKAIQSVTWPPGSDHFTLYPVKQANGVVPIKKNCMSYLTDKGWSPEQRISIASRLRPGPVDAVKALKQPKEEVKGLHQVMTALAAGHGFSPVRSLPRQISGIANTMRSEYIVMMQRE